MTQMNMNNIVKICFLLIILLVQVCESLIPVDRYGPSSVLVDKKIYFFGGVSYHSPKYSPTLDQVLYLDVSQPFNIANPPFVEIPNVSIPFGSTFATASLDPKKNIIYLFGGVMVDVNTNLDNFKSSLHTFNIETNKWDIPKTNGIEPERRRDINGVNSDKTGKFYVFGGVTDQFTGAQNFKSFNDMNIFDTTSLTWSKGSTINVPLSRIDYTVTLLSNGIIVYIGGREDPAPDNPNMPLRDVDINQVSLYDTNTDKWSSMATRGVTLENRNAHSAVLTPDERIIIFGGRKGDDVVGSSIIQQLAVLDTKTSPYEWSTPSVTATTLPPTLVYHSATLVENYMFINFGNNTYPIINSEVQIPFFHILDINNFTWITQFEPRISITTKNPTSPTPTPTNSPTNSPSSDNSSNGKTTGMIVGIVVSVGVISSVFGFLGYKFYKKRKYDHVIPTAGTNNT